jgi:hypothetical protein
MSAKTVGAPTKHCDECGEPASKANPCSEHPNAPRVTDAAMVCRHCNARFWRPGVTCGNSRCQEAEYHATMRRGSKS